MAVDRSLLHWRFPHSVAFDLKRPSRGQYVNGLEEDIALAQHGNRSCDSTWAQLLQLHDIRYVVYPADLYFSTKLMWKVTD